MAEWWRSRKLRKLARNPDLFFYDLFRKRLNGASSSQDTIGLEEPLPRDSITNLEHMYDAAVTVLTECTVAVQPIAVAHPNVRRLAIRSKDMNYALEAICSTEFGKYRPVVRAKSDGRLYELTFADDRFEYRNPVIELDPWTVSGSYVQSPNANKFASAVGVRDVHRTVCSPGPLALAGDSSRPVPLEEALGLSAGFLGAFCQPLDVVYIWVDDCDPNWARSHNRGQLRYSLRSIAAFLPEVRNIFVVTDGTAPAWLDTAHDKIHVVDHREIFADTEHLPTFNLHAIEANLHRIEGLAEHFLYFSDDVLLMNPCVALDFFHPNGIGKSFYQPVGKVYGEESLEYATFKNAALRAGKLLLDKFGKSAHFYHERVVHPLRTSVIDQMWNEFPDVFEATSAARIRGDNDDVPPLSFFYHYYALERCASVPGEISSCQVPLRRGSDKLLTALRSDTDTKVVCLGDLPATDANEGIAATSFLQFMWPVAAGWELDK